MALHVLSFIIMKDWYLLHGEQIWKSLNNLFDTNLVALRKQLKSICIYEVRDRQIKSLNTIKGEILIF